MNLPMQPIHLDSRGVARFTKNRIVDDLLEFATSHGFGLNEIAAGDYSDDERMQMAQIIGYSVGGYGELSYVSDESFNYANEKAMDLQKMTDYNSMKADEYAQRLGAEQELELEIERMTEDVYSELPEWIQALDSGYICDLSYDEAKRRVMQAIKERNEP